MFYAPMRGMSEARDRAPLVPAMVIAFLTQLGYASYTQWPYVLVLYPGRSFLSIVVVNSIGSLITTAFIFVPAAILIANLFERRGSLSLALQQEFASTASTIFYALAAANIAAMPLALLAKSSGWAFSLNVQYLDYLTNLQKVRPDMVAVVPDPRWLIPGVLSMLFLQMLTLPFLAATALVAVRAVFGLSWLRSIIVLVGAAVLMGIAANIMTTLFGLVIASPFLILLIFFLMRGYVSEATRTHRARASFKQNLEAATLNPADASAHYNLGLIHQQRGELDEARERFERAVEIDREEVDAHYQLGRIARQQNRFADAIQNFEPVIEHNQAHAQYEVWREIGATYLAAEQFEDARDTLERFLAQRPSDPEGLYLMGRAHAGLGHQSEATAAMQACIEAVKTAPAYKYRADKRWLDQAQEFIKSSQ
jgi:tetratricopeptide (TPR) repeat protein